MRFEDCSKNTLITYKIHEKSTDFDVYVQRTLFDNEFIESCKSYCKRAFDVNINGFSGRNKFFSVKLVMSQVRRSRSYDLAFTVTVYDKIKNKDDAEKFTKIIRYLIDSENCDDTKLKELGYDLEWIQFVTDILALTKSPNEDKEPLKFNKDYTDYVSKIMSLDMHTDEPDFCPEPDEIKIENDIVYYVPNTNVKSTRVIRDADGVYIEHVIGHDIVLTKLV